MKNVHVIAIVATLFLVGLGLSQSTVLTGFFELEASAAVQGPGACLTVSNTAAITIPSGPGTSGAASPYPSNVTVSGLGGTVTKVTVKLNGLAHTFPSDIDILLVGPAGQNAIIMSDVGNGSAVTGVTLTLDDSAVPSMPITTLTTGTYRPTNPDAGDTFTAPAPTPSGPSPENPSGRRRASQ